MSQYLMKITIGSHFFKVTNFDDNVKTIIYEFLGKYVKYGLEKIPGSGGRYRKVMTGVFADATKDRREIRFHINQYDDFLKALDYKFINVNKILFERLPEFKPLPLDLPLHTKWVGAARENQKPVIEYLNDDSKITAKFIGMQTGFGKGMVTMVSAAEYNKVIGIVLRPMFIHKWILDLQKYLQIEPEQIMVVRGGEQLKLLLEQKKQNLVDDVKVFIFSNKTLQIWFKEYSESGENIRERGYDITPEELFPYLNIGLRIVDEVHLDFHLNFKIDLYTHVPKAISLSATLENKDPFLVKMYELAYPIKDRYKSPPIEKYSTARCVLYGIDNAPYVKIKASEYGSKNYSHNAFESFIMANPDRLKNYLKLITHITQISFMDDYVPGERLVIFAFKKEMCTLIVNHLLKVYPNIDIRRYVSEDPNENMYEPVIRVTTLGSGSTAHDITRLKTAIMTVNVDSLQSNIQAFGRLRKITDLQTRFFYFICSDVPKHMQYHNAKMELLRDRALNFNIINAPFSI